MERTLYRAAEDTYCQTGSTCFAARETDARAYLDNPGFGGRTLYRCTVEIDPATVLDLRQERPEWLRGMIDDLGAVELSWAITACTTIQDTILAHGYRWVRFTDDYPIDCETWCLLLGEGDDYGDEEIEPRMEEV